MPNASVERFKRLTEELRDEVRAGAVAELNNQADNLVRVMQSVAPSESGQLEHSIRKLPGRSPTQVRVVAGGRATIRPAISSQPYDYSRADEFGTRDMPARPFFFPTYRLMRPKMIAAMKRKIATAIKKRGAE